MDSLGSGELKLLRRLAINPFLRPTELAGELGVSRSAVSQLWKKLERERDLRVRGNLDLGKLGLQLVFGWAAAAESADLLQKFSGWLRTNSSVTRMTRSVMSSTMDARIYFEALVSHGRMEDWFLGQIGRFEKRPYSLSIEHGTASTISYHTNLGLFDGSSWEFGDYFRFEASIGAAKGYVDVLPLVGTVDQSSPIGSPVENLIYGGAIEDDFHVTASRVSQKFKEAGLPSPSDRTMRRKLKQFKTDIARPYVELRNIGLDQNLMVCLRNTEALESPLSRLLRAQASSFPRARVVSGSELTVLDLEVPGQVDWLTMSQILSSLTGNTSEICTFIANRHEIQKRLESIIAQYISSRLSG